MDIPLQLGSSSATVNIHDDDWLSSLMTQDNPNKRKPRGKLDMEKCERCRKDKKKVCNFPSLVTPTPVTPQ